MDIDEEEVEQAAGASDFVLAALDDDDDEDAVLAEGGVGFQIGGGVASALAPADQEEEEEDDEEEEDARAARYEEQMDAAETLREDVDDVKSMIQSIQETLQDLDDNGDRVTAWGSLQEMVNVMHHYCHMDGGIAPPDGGHNLILFVEEPLIQGSRADPNLYALAMANKYTCRPRFRAIADIFYRSVRRERPGKVNHDDIQALSEVFNKRAPQQGKLFMIDENRKKFQLVVRSFSNFLIRFKIPHVLITTNKAKVHTRHWGYSKKYPIFNLAMAAAGCKNLQSIPQFLENERRMTPGHHERDYCELEGMLTELLSAD